MKKMILRSAAMAVLAVAGAQASASTVFNYNDFSSTAGLQLNGSAASTGGVLRVTPSAYSQAGSMFSTNTVSLASNASFSTFFQFRFSSPFGSDGSGTGADGLVFALQTNSNTAGGAGGGIGFAGINHSVGIEFDTWNNGAGDGYSSNHVGVDINGNVNSAALAAVTEADMNNGGTWNAWVDYDGASHQLEVRLTQSLLRPTAALLSYTYDIASALGSTNAYVGFTSGTGGAGANHDVLSWTMADNFAPIGAVPEPASLALVGVGLAGMGALRRRRAARA
jgi:hypothetical protein